MRKFLKLSLLGLILLGTLIAFNNVAQASPAYETDAFIGYKSNTGTVPTAQYPKVRTWTGTTATWSAESELANSGSPIRWVRTAWSTNATRYKERIVVTLSDDGGLDAYVWNGAAWTVTALGSVGVTNNAWRAFDIAYEKTKGRAMVVYGVSPGSATSDLAYRIWDGTSWSAEAYINDSGDDVAHTDFNVVALASKPSNGANEIALVALDRTHSHINGWIWNGVSWGNQGEITAVASVATYEPLGVAYESSTGYAWFVAGEAGQIRVRRWASSSWDAATTVISVGGNPNFLTVKADPVGTSNYIMVTSVDASSDLNMVFYNGAWQGTVEHDTGLDINTARCADFDWNPTGSTGLVVYGTSSGSLTYRTFTGSTNTWSGTSTVVAAGTHPWVQLRRQPRDVSATDVEILGAFLDSNNDLGSLKWDAAVLTAGVAAFTADTVVQTYECFEIEFAPVFQTPPTIAVSPASQLVGSHGVFPVDITISSAGDRVYAWEFQLFYDTTILSAVTEYGVTPNATEGGFLKTGGSTFFSTIEVNDAYNSTHGRVWLTATLLGNVAGVTGSGTLARIYFTEDSGIATSFLRLRGVKLVGYTTAYKKLFAIPYTITEGQATVNFVYTKPRIYVDPTTKTVSNGATFTIDVNVTNVKNLYFYNFRLYFLKLVPAQEELLPLINATGVTEGAFLGTAGATTFKKQIRGFTNGTGEFGDVWVNGTLSGNNAGATGGGVLATITFQANATGTGTRTLELANTVLVGHDTTLYKPGGVSYDMVHSKYYGSVTVTAAVPEFPLGFMLEIALIVAIAYVWLGRKRKIKAIQPLPT